MKFLKLFFGVKPEYKSIFFKDFICLFDYHAKMYYVGYLMSVNM